VKNSLNCLLFAKHCVPKNLLIMFAQKIVKKMLMKLTLRSFEKKNKNRNGFFFGLGSMSRVASAVSFQHVPIISRVQLPQAINNECQPSFLAKDISQSIFLL
jgi:hypothetical protein